MCWVEGVVCKVRLAESVERSLYVFHMVPAAKTFWCLPSLLHMECVKNRNT